MYKMIDHESNAFVINHETKVYLYPPLNAVSKSLREGTLPNAQIEFQNVQATVEQDISKLGGLSKEYAILKDIIISSSVKSTLSRYVFMNFALIAVNWMRILLITFHYLFWANYFGILIIIY